MHEEFGPQYVISSSWSNDLSRKQMQDVFRRTGLRFIAENLHSMWTTPKSEHSTRTEEIEDWIAENLQAGQPLLVIDDHNSGWGLVESSLDQQGRVVCATWALGLYSLGSALRRPPYELS